MLYGDWIGRWGKSFPEAEAIVDIGLRHCLLALGKQLQDCQHA